MYLIIFFARGFDSPHLHKIKNRIMRFLICSLTFSKICYRIYSNKLFVTMNISSVCISTIAVCAYLFMFKKGFKKRPKEDEKLNFSSFLLWSIIDVLMWRNTIKANNDYTLIGTYTVCTILLTIILLLKKQFKWTRDDTIVACIAALCLYISYTTGAVVGVVAGALSLFSAGIPNLKKMLKQRPSAPFYAMIFLFFLAPFVSLMIEFAKNADVKDFVYPCTSAFYWVLLYLLHWRYHHKRIT